MARPTQEAIQTFTSITGASESVALQKLEEFGGNLHEAVNAYFSEGYRHNTHPTVVGSPQYNASDMSNRIQAGPSRLLQLFSAARTFKPSSLLDNYRRSLLNGLGASSYTSHAPIVPHTGEVTSTPTELNSGNQQLYHPGGWSSAYDSRTSSPHGPDAQGNVLQNDISHVYGNTVEEEMIQAALEASKRDAEEGQLNKLLEDDELSHAVSLSLKTAEQENTMRKQVRGLEQQLGILNVLDHSQRNKNDLPSNGWGGISSKELDEAIMLEAALFSANSEGTSHGLKYEPHQQSGPDRSMGPNLWPVSNASSSSVIPQWWLLREQQDKEYIASLLADREKEANALKQAESLRLKDDDESRKKLLEEEKLERWLAMKESLLPPEPASNDGNAVTLLVRMPDGTRHGRRFLKSDKLKFLFDFIDVGRTVKPGTYNVVRPYPRRAFNVSDGSLSLTEVGLTSKQEALFLEFI